MLLDLDDIPHTPEEPTLCPFCLEWQPMEHVCVKPEDREDREELEPGQAPQVVTRPGD
jgi:hypothetical protein